MVPGDFMTDKNAIRFTAISFYALALAIFISVSLISIYQILTLIAVVLLFKHKEINFKKLPKSSLALLAYIGVQLLSAAVNFSELSDKARSIGSVKYPLIGILSVLIFSHHKIQNDVLFKKHARIAFNIFLSTIAIAFVYGITKVNTGHELVSGNDARIGGFTDVMRYGYGSALALIVMFAIGLNFKKFTQINKIFFWIVYVIGLAGMYLSFTRGAMLGLLVGIPAVLLHYNKRICLLASVISLSVIGTMVVVSLNGGNSQSRFFLSSTSNSNSERKSQFLSAIHGFQERPILGFGPQQLKFHVKEIKEKYDLENKQYIEHAHNVFLEVAADTGIIGLIVFLAWLGLWTKELFCRSNDLGKQIFLPVILFLLVAGQFEMLLMAQTSTLIYFLYAISHLEIFKKESAT
ncbi:hypothetical protein CIK05_07040 [Bdellovibrio sp. qaytius]|nr:hypothetical protein CIK05_07040 [Bdellovibrio sp. qaytius]